MNSQVTKLIRKELTTEWRQRYALNGIVLQVLSSVFVVYLSVRIMNAPTWNGVFWIVMLFVSVSSVARSFIGEGRGRNLYYHGIVKPQNLLLAKFIYNAILNIFLAALCLAAYTMLLGMPVINFPLYAAATLLGCMGFAGTFTMLSAIASRAGNSNLLMPVLSLPVIIPMLLILMKACKRAMDGIDPTLIYADLGVLLLLNFMIVALAVLLFPSVWKE